MLQSFALALIHIAMGNNPMDGDTVTCAVCVFQTLKK